MRTIISFSALLCALAAAPAWAQDAPKPAAEAKPKVISIAFFQFEAQNVDAKTASIISDELLVLLSKMPGSNVIGSKEVDAMLGFEQKKQMSGCTDTSCMVAIGGALGVDKILMGSLGKLGESYILSLKLLDIRAGKVEQLYSKRLRGGKEEDFLDILPEALASVFPASASTWVKTDKKSEKAPETYQVVDLQRKPGEIKINEAKEPPIKPPEEKKAEEKKPEPKKPEPAKVAEAPKPVEKPAAVEKKVEPKPEPQGPYSHDEQVFVAVKQNVAVSPTGFSNEVHLGYAFSKWFELGAGGIIALAKGGVVRATVFVYNPDGAVKPFIGVHAPVLFTSDGLVIGAGGSLGVQWDFWRHMGLTLEVPVNYMLSAPAGYATLIVMGTAGAQVRF